MYVCEICKKGSNVGIDSTHRYGGGWSMRGQRTRKVWKPNLHSLRIKKNGQTLTMRLCTKCARKEKASMKVSRVPASSQAVEAATA